MENILLVLFNVFFILWFINHPHPHKKKLKSLVIKKEKKKFPIGHTLEIEYYFDMSNTLSLISWGINMDFQKRFISCQHLLNYCYIRTHLRGKNRLRISSVLDSFPLSPPKWHIVDKSPPSPLKWHIDGNFHFPRLNDPRLTSLQFSH